MPARPARHRHRLEDRGDGVEVMAEVARRGEIGRLAIFVAAIAGIGVVAAKAASSRAWSSASSAKPKSLRLSSRCSLSPSRAPMIAAATASCSSTQRVATLEIETPCLLADFCRPPPECPGTPSQPPAASMKRLYFERLQSAMSLRLRLAQPFVGKEAAAQRAVGEQLHALFAAERRKLAGRAAVDQREGHLVGGERDAVGQRDAQMRGVEIGDADRADQPLFFQPRHLMQRVEPGRMLEGPPVELQQVDLLDAEPVEPLLHAPAHDVRCHRPGLRAPFGEGERPLCLGRVAREQPAGDHLGAAIVVGHVERVEAGLGIGLERVGAAFRIERLADPSRCRRPATGRRPGG